MAKWVECKAAINGSIFINLDNVASLAPVRGGSEITFVGGGDDLLVASSPEQILLSEDVHGA